MANKCNPTYFRFGLEEVDWKAKEVILKTVWIRQLKSLMGAANKSKGLKNIISSKLFYRVHHGRIASSSAGVFLVAILVFVRVYE